MRFAFVFALCCLTATASAQHEHSPYATHEHAERSIAALSADEVASLEKGEGMGFALAAELNGYPGPKHALELKDDLGLTSEQVAATQALFETMQAAAQALGEQLLGVERHMNARFGAGDMDHDALERMTNHAGSLRAQLRATHLEAHLDMMDILSDEQVERYSELRGYKNEGD